MAAAGDRGALSAPDPESTTASETSDGAADGARRRWLVRIVVVSLAVAVIAGVVAVAAPRLFGSEEPAQQREVLQRTEDFAVTYNTYTVAEKDDYQERMRDLLTAEYYQEFATVTDAVFGALESNDQVSGDARVLASAVQSIDGENAVVLVAVNASVTTDADEAAVERRFRWKVTLQREDGDWLVSAFEQVAPVQAELGQPGEEGGLPPDDLTPQQAPDGSEPSTEEEQ